MGEMVQSVKYHAKREMLDFLNYMGDQSIERATGGAASPEEAALQIRFGLLLKKYSANLQANIFTEDDCRYVYKELKKKEAKRMAHLERSCLKDWQKDYENRERRSMDWERSGVDHVRQKYGLDPEIDAHRAFKETLSDGKPLKENSFEDFLRDGKLSERPELDMSGVGFGRDTRSKDRGRG